MRTAAIRAAAGVERDCLTQFGEVAGGGGSFTSPSLAIHEMSCRINANPQNQIRTTRLNVKVASVRNDDFGFVNLRRAFS